MHTILTVLVCLCGLIYAVLYFFDEAFDLDYWEFQQPLQIAGLVGLAGSIILCFIIIFSAP